MVAGTRTPVRAGLPPGGAWGSVKVVNAPTDFAPYNDYDVAVSSIHNVLEKNAAPAWEFSWVRRRHYGLIRVMEGTAVFEAADWRHAAEPGDILYVEREDTYRVSAGDEGSRFIVANFFVAKDTRQTPFPFPHVIRSARVSLYETLFRELHVAWTGKGVAHRLLSRSVLDSILYNLVRDALQARLHAHGIGKIQAALTHIENNYNTDVRVDDLAAMVGVTAAYFRRLFKDATGHSPKDYILYLRILRSMDYVKSDLYSLAEIAEKLGFSSVSHFSRAFKNRTGQSPMAYRRDA